MRQSCQTVLGILFPILLWPVSVSAEAIHNLNEAVNVAGRQRMYTMQMLKDYIMIGEKLTYNHPEADLKAIVDHFQDAHESLLTFVEKDAALSAELKHIGTLWSGIKTMTAEPPRRDRAALYAKQAIAFRDQLDVFVSHLARSETRATAEVINASGRLRAISQALAAMYLLRAWEMPLADEQIKRPMEHFRQTLDELKRSKATHAPMKTILDDLEKIYLFFDVMNHSKVTTPTLAIRKTDAMLKKASKLTELYVQSIK